jgi:citrate/tricarballylate utilization protein
VNIPKLFAELREETHRKYAWPEPVAHLAEGVSWFPVRAALAGVVLLLALVLALAGPSRVLAGHTGPGAFYQVIPYAVMVAVFGALGFMWMGAWVVEGYRYWRAIMPPRRGRVGLSVMLGASSDALSLRYLGGGGAGCADPSEHTTNRKRWMHHLVGYGFGLDLASTTLAAIYQHAFHIEAPYPLTNPVVILGALGGIGIIVGGVGLLVLKLGSDREASKESVIAGDLGFLTSLLLVALSGMLLLAVRSTAAMGSVLAVHLGCVAAFFITAPYNKFRHAVYRYMSLLRYRSDGDRHAKEPSASRVPAVDNVRRA